MVGIWIVSTLAWWGFAFAPYGTKVPEWFLAAKNACFGTMPNGLPDTSGWLLLTLGPLSFLIGLIIAWREEITTSLREFLSQKAGKTVAVFIILAVSVQSFFVAREIRAGLQVANFDFTQESSEDLPVDYPRAQTAAPEFKLIDQHGEIVSLEKFKGEVVVLTFAFAHCSTVCPTLVHQCKEGFVESEVRKSRLVVITLDPWRDRPSTLSGLAETWKLPERSHVLSGKIEDVKKAIADYGVNSTRDENTGDIIHPAMVFVIDQNGKLAFTFNNAPSRWIKQAIRRLNEYGLASD